MDMLLEPEPIAKLLWWMFLSGSIMSLAYGFLRMPIRQMLRFGRRCTDARENGKCRTRT